MKPRAAGLTGIVVALALAVLGGYLLARPPWSIPGALVLAAASVALSVSIVWTRRRSWAEPWPPDLTPSLRQRMRRAKVWLFVNVALFTTSIAFVVVGFVDRLWNQLPLAVFWMLATAGNMFAHRTTLRVLEQQRVPERQKGHSS